MSDAKKFVSTYLLSLLFLCFLHVCVKDGKTNTVIDTITLHPGIGRTGPFAIAFNTNNGYLYAAGQSQILHM